MKPNFLFIFPDQHRPDWLGNNPKLPLRTPNLDNLASTGVRFTNAYTPSPICMPARACLATGRDYAHCGVEFHQNTPYSMPTYYRSLRESGYWVAGVGKFDLHKKDLDWGLDGSRLLPEYGFSSGVDNEGKGDAIVSYLRNNRSPKGPYMKFLQELGLLEIHLKMYEPYLDTPQMLNFPAITDLPDEAYCDNWVAGNAIKALENLPYNQPWHLVVNFVGPHGPFDVTRAMRSRWENVELPPPVDNPDDEGGLVRLRRQNYAAMIENIDWHIGKMLDVIRERGELDHTIIVYASDHGEMLGDHGKWGKCLWYTPSSGVPLIISGPGIPSGRVSDALVCLQDLAATFLDYGEAQPIPEMEAISLRAVLEGRTEHHREFIQSGLVGGPYHWKMNFDGHFKLVIQPASAPILYDLDNDPYEEENCINSHPDVASRLASQLGVDAL